MTGVLDSLRRKLFPGRNTGAGGALEAAIAHHEAGRLDEAERAYLAILDRDPAHPGALHLYGVVAHQRGNHDEALQRIRRAIAARSEISLYHFNLGNVLTALGDVHAAGDAYASAVRLDPDHCPSWFNLGKSLAQRGRDAEAEAAFRRATALQPDMQAARDELARALIASADRTGGRPAAYDEGILLLLDSWQEADDPVLSRMALAHALEMRQRFTEAAEHYRGVVAARPDIAAAHRGLGNCCNQSGSMQQAVRHYRDALQLDPQNSAGASSVASGLIYDSTCTPEEVCAEHRRWGELFAAPLTPARPEYGNSRDPSRRLKIGYVSPDFRRHPVTAIFLPVLERHDPLQVETVCYYNFGSADVVTDRVRRSANAWRNIAGMPDAAVAERVRADGIDILVDLAGHTSRQRLLAFAYRPAPVQVSWIGYFCTTGVAAIDYFITDPHSSPPGQDRFFVERLVRLPATRFCYEPSEFMPEVSPLPAARQGFPTFGCCNNLAKIGPEVLATWARILAAVPGSRLIVQAGALNEAENRIRTLSAARDAGLPAERIELRPYAPIETAAQAYRAIDVALDPFPFGGGMTSLEALWMGVPVVTLAGELIAGRQTMSMLANLGTPELIAKSVDEYVAIAIDIAGNLERLARLRAALRPRFMSSPLADYVGMARSIEAAYRCMWRTWVQDRAAEPISI